MWRLKNPVKQRMQDGNTGVVMGFLPEGARNHLVAWLAELAGTFLFLFFSFSIATVANTPPAPADSRPLPDVSKLLYVSLGFGCSVAINVWIFYRISGGQLNPAVCVVVCAEKYASMVLTLSFLQVTLTLWLVGAVPAIRCVVIVTAQILGGIAAAGASSALLPGPFPVNVRLGGGTSVVRGLFIEMFTTTMLVMTVIMLAAVKSKSTWLAPIGIGIALFIGHLLSEYTRFSREKKTPVIISLTKMTTQVFITPAPGSTQPAPSVPTSSPVPSPGITGSTGWVRVSVRCLLLACGTSSRVWAGRPSTQARTTMISRRRRSIPTCRPCDPTSTFPAATTTHQMSPPPPLDPRLFLVSRAIVRCTTTTNTNTTTASTVTAITTINTPAPTNPVPRTSQTTKNKALSPNRRRTKKKTQTENPVFLYTHTFFRRKRKTTFRFISFGVGGMYFSFAKLSLISA